MNTVGARGFERFDSPFDCLLHGGRAWDAAADLIGQLLQVSFEGRGLPGFSDYSTGWVLGEGGAEENGEKKSAHPGTWHKAELEIKFRKRAKIRVSQHFFKNSF